jgi:hypothetical protein
MEKFVLNSKLPNEIVEISSRNILTTKAAAIQVNNKQKQKRIKNKDF